VAYDVTFDSDIKGGLSRGDYDIVEITAARESWHVEPTPTAPSRIHHDGSRLVLPLGPEHTSDDRYSTTEVASSPRFDQANLDRMLAEGSDRVVVPGREAAFRGFLASPHFVDGRAADETVTAGATFQSWRGLESRAQRPAFMGVSIVYLGGSGFVPALFNRSWKQRRFVASVIDFNTGLNFNAVLPDVDFSEPHDLRFRWFPNRDVEFLVDDRRVAYYEDGPLQVTPLTFYKRFRRGVDFIGHRRLTADPCHIDAWVNCSATGNSPDVFTGKQFTEDLSVALAGFGIHPL